MPATWFCQPVFRTSTSSPSVAVVVERATSEVAVAVELPHSELLH
jgi:hypothetical protein